jgi:hypothetical protein
VQGIEEAEDRLSVKTLIGVITRGIMGMAVDQEMETMTLEEIVRGKDQDREPEETGRSFRHCTAQSAKNRARRGRVC